MKKKRKISGRKILSYLLILTMLIGLMPGISLKAQAEESPEVTLYFPEGWGIPSGITMGTNSYSNGTYTIQLYGPGSYGYKNNSGYLIMGKNGAFLELPVFDFDVEKIVVTGHSGASTAVLFNIYVGETAVSTEAKGSTGTQTFEIGADYQAAGNVYKLMVNSNHNVQITKIEIYKKESPPQTVATPMFSPAAGTYTEAQNVTLSCETDGATIHYTTDGSNPTSSSAVYSSAIPVNATTTIKAIAVKEGMTDSSVASGTYTINIPPEPIELTYTSETDNVKWTDRVASGGWWQIQVKNEDINVSISNRYSTSVPGTYAWKDLDQEYCFIRDNKTGVTSYFQGGSCTVTVNEGVVNVKGTFSCADGNTYAIDITYTPPIVTITAGENMTKTTDSGAASQAVSGAITDVVYTADDGYYFPTDYSVTAVNGISVTRNSYTQITVSGTATADAEITLPAPTQKTTPSAPTTAAATDCTTADNNDGTLTGVTTAMEYKKSDAADWTDGTGSDITGLVPGTYYVRVKATETTNASTNQELTIKGFISYTVTFKVVNGKWNEGEGDAATADKTVTLTGHDGDTLKLTADQIPAVGTKPNDTYKAGSWDVTPSTDTAITAATTYTYTYAAKEASVVTKAPEAKTLTYTGSAQELVTAGEATGGEMQYALGDANGATQPYTTSIPTGTEAGTYYVWYKVAGDDNHLDTNPLCVKVKIMNTGMFADIEYGTWKYTAAEAVYEKQIMVGKGMVDGKIIFAPDDKVNRSQFVTSIYAMDGKPDVDYVQRFSDVKESDWFAKAVTWASNNEITAGTGDGQFGATGNATREQAAVMLYKYAQYCGYDVTISESTTLDGFADADKVHSWALDAVKWAVERKIISGKGKSPDLRIAPDQSATRIECAAMLNRFSEVCTLAMIPDEILEEPIALPMEDIEESPASIDEPEEDIEDESEDIIDDEEKEVIDDEKEEIIDDEEKEVIDDEEEEIIDDEEEEVIDDEEEIIIDDEKEEVIENRETEGI